MAEKTNAQLLKELKNKLKIGSKGGALSSERVAYSKWLADNTGIKLLPNGEKVTVWKTGPNKGKVFDKSIGSKQFLKGHYGTETPRKDYKYLKESELSRQRFDVQKGDSIRTNLSKKDYEGNNIYQQEVAARQAKDQLRLNKLSIGTSYEKKTPIGSKFNPNIDLNAPKTINYEQSKNFGKHTGGLSFKDRQVSTGEIGGLPALDTPFAKKYTPVELKKELGRTSASDPQKGTDQINTGSGKFAQWYPDNKRNQALQIAAAKKNETTVPTTSTAQPTAAGLTADLRALNTLNKQNLRGLQGSNVTLAIMRKEQQLSKLKGDTHPSLTGRDHHGVGYSTGKEARDWLKINKLR